MCVRRVVILGVVFAVAARAAAARADTPTLASEVGQMLEVGERISPKAAASAQQLYENLRGAHPGDPRVQYAYALVLIRQHKLDEAGKLLTQVVDARPDWLAAWRANVWVNLAGRKFTLALDGMGKAASAVEQSITPEESPARDECHQTARFLGRAYGYLDNVQRRAISVDQLRRRKQQMLSRLGEARSAFEEGEESIATDVRQLEVELETARRTAEAVASEKQQQAEAKKKDLDQAEAHVDLQAGKISADANAKAEAIEKQATASRLKIAQLQIELGRVQAAVNAQRVQVVQANAAMKQHRHRRIPLERERFPYVQKYLDELLIRQEQVAAALERENTELERFAAAGQAVKQDAAHASAELETKSAELSQQEKKIGRPQTSVSFGRTNSLEQQKRAFSSYEPFRYDQERQSFLATIE